MLSHGSFQWWTASVVSSCSLHRLWSSRLATRASTSVAGHKRRLRRGSPRLGRMLSMRRLAAEVMPLRPWKSNWKRWRRGVAMKRFSNPQAKQSGDTRTCPRIGFQSAGRPMKAPFFWGKNPWFSANFSIQSHPRHRPSRLRSGRGHRFGTLAGDAARARFGSWVKGQDHGVLWWQGWVKTMGI